nr:hypothetical protein A4A49_06179 [Ipomoea batatas]GME05750.1 hypothetical protein A4A49_06179 [Ipomoea batatas]
MESGRELPNSKSYRNLPPRRGLIKMKIFKSLVKSAAEFASGRKDDGGGSLSPLSAPSPTGYHSGADSDGSPGARPS